MLTLTLKNQNNGKKVKTCSELMWMETEIKALYGQENICNNNEMYCKYSELKKQYSLLEIE